MSQLASYKRYWEPSLGQVIGVSLPVGALITILTHPIEFVKTRIQVRAEGIGMVNKNHWIGYNSHKVFRQIHETGAGFRGLYVGIEAAVISRMSYLMIRNVLYKTIYDATKPRKVTNDLSGREKGFIAGCAGGVAALMTTPMELIMVRQIADGGLPENLQRNYQGFSHALKTIMAEEGGSRALFKGGYMTIARAVVMNASLTGPYDYLREKMWITFGDFGFVDVIPVFYAALWATALTLPFDNLKTRIQKSFADPIKNRIDYRSLRQCIVATMNVEGPLGLYVGAYPFYMKMLVTCFLTSWITGQFTKNWKRKAGLKEWQI